MNSLQNNLNLRFNNICQLDLAVDTNFDVFSILSAIVDQHISNPYFQGLEKIDHEVVKKFGGRNISEGIYGSIIPNLKVLQPYPSTIYIGGSQNGKQIKVYDKNLLHETYQYEHFQKNLGHNSCWYRLECSLIRNNDPNQFDEEIKLENLNDDQFLIDLFFKKCSKLLTFKNLNDFEKKKNSNKI